jgi:hypothetical protein
MYINVPENIYINDLAMTGGICMLRYLA